MGPSTFNFAEAAQESESAGAALRVSDLDEAVKVALDVSNSGKKQALQAAAMAFAQSFRGAAKRSAQSILDSCSH